MRRTEHAWWRPERRRRWRKNFNGGGQALYRRDRIALGKAAALATTAQTLNSQGLAEHAFDALMDVEPLIFEATAL
jgi:hypothetical protein